MAGCDWAQGCTRKCHWVHIYAKCGHEPVGAPVLAPHTSAPSPGRACGPRRPEPRLTVVGFVADKEERRSKASDILR